MEKRFIDELRSVNERFEELNEYELKLVEEIKNIIRADIAIKGLAGTTVSKVISISDEMSQYINSNKINNYMQNVEGLTNFKSGMEAKHELYPLTNILMQDIKLISFRYRFSVSF